MNAFPHFGLRHLTFRITAGISADALLANLCYRLDLNLATTSLLFLMAVVFQALGGGVLSSIIASVAAAAFLDFFFVPPVLTWRIADPFNAVALLVFISTSLLITGLASRARSEANRAERRRNSLDHLYQASQRLLWIPPEADVIAVLLKAFREVFGLRAVCFFDGTAAESHLEGASVELEGETRRAYLTGGNLEDRRAGLCVRCLRHAGKAAGAIGFDGLRDPELTAGPLVALAVGVLERALAAQAATQAAAEAQGEVFRAAVLDAMAHEFKTPLAVITTAAGALRETGPLTEGQVEMADTIEEEAERLGYLTTRLLRKTEIDRKEIQPRLKESDLAALVGRVVDRHGSRLGGRRILLHHGGELAGAMVDEELFSLAVSQLLDNAVKYSPPGSDVVVTLSRRRGGHTVRVWNDNSTIAEAERHRIFERFYRGAHGQIAAAGSGLGLYVARKIARAHGGSLELDSECMDSGSTAFCLTLPPPTGEAHDAVQTDQSAACR